MGLKTPDTIPPKSDITANWYLSHFSVLSTSRTSNGYGPNPIAISEMISYLGTLVPIYEVDKSIRILQSLDIVYLNHSAEKSKAKTDAKQPVKPPRK